MPEQKILSEQQVAEIEKHFETSIDSMFARSHIPALCQTVRAAWTERDALTDELKVADDALENQVKWIADLRGQLVALTEENVALRQDQLEGETCELCCDDPTNDDQGNPLTFLVCGCCWNKRESEVIALREQLAAAQDELTKTRHFLTETQAERDANQNDAQRFQTQLAQVEQERDAALETLHSMTEAMAEGNRRRTL